MKVYIFCEQDSILNNISTTSEKILLVLNRVVQNTDTDNLVVSVFLILENNQWGGCADVRKWQTSNNYFTPCWRYNRNNLFVLPHDLPVKFKHIKLYFGSKILVYPGEFKDKYGYIWHFQSFEDHLSFVFAHELHHFRRYHLGLHSKESEIHAEEWAFQYVKTLGYNVTLIKREKIVHRKRAPLSLEVKEAYERLRLVQPGTLLEYLRPFDSLLKSGEIVKVLRPLRKNAFRIASETADGKRLLLPIKFLRIK